MPIYNPPPITSIPVTPTPVWTGTNVIASRSINSVFQNTTGKWIIIIVAVGGTNAVNGAIQILSDNTNPPTTPIASKCFQGASFGAFISGLVAPNAFYKVNAPGIITLSTWLEYNINKGTISDSGDIKASRSINTTFQNTTVNTLWVAVQVTFTAGTGTVHTFLTDNSNPPVTQVGKQITGGTNAIFFTFIFPVPAGQFYRFNQSGGAGNAIIAWHEYTHSGVQTIQSVSLSTRPVPAQNSTTIISNGYLNNTGKCCFADISFHVGGTPQVQFDFCSDRTVALPKPSEFTIFESAGTTNPMNVFCFLHPGDSYYPTFDVAGTGVTDNWTEFYLS